MQYNSRVRNQQQLQDLQEPLISEDTRNNYNEHIIQQYEQDLQEKLKPKERKNENQEDQEMPQFQPINFQKLNEDYAQFGSSDYDNDPSSFLKQSMAKFDIPHTTIQNFKVHQNDPSIFAVLTGASSYFNSNAQDLKLRELICLTDYKNLENIRLRNYIFLLRMLTKIQPDLYQEVKERLLQIQSLCKYLGLFGSEKIYQEIKQTYKRLEKDKQIYDLDQPTNKQNKNYEDYDRNEIDEDDSDNNDEGEEDEYEGFFKNSKLNNQTQSEWEDYQQGLMQEEDKWTKRAEWLEDLIDKIRQSSDQAVLSWLPWIEVKLESLQELDIDLKGNYTKSSIQNEEVLFMPEFLKKNIKKQDVSEPPKPPSDQLDKEEEFPTNYDDLSKNLPQNDEIKPDIHFNDKYKPDQQINMDQSNFYPKVKFNMKEATNNNMPLIDQRHNVREKFCLRIQSREAQTDYFLTVFKRKNLGNEKLFEKRLNFNGQEIHDVEMEFHPSSKYLYFQFYYGGKTIDLVFSLIAHHKDPLLLKSNSKFFGFFGDKNVITYKETTIKVKDQTRATRYLKRSTVAQSPSKQPEQFNESQSNNNQEDLASSSSQGNAFNIMNKLNIGLKNVHFVSEVIQLANEQKKEEVFYKEIQVLRIYQYDLYNFDTIQSIDMISDEPNDTINSIVSDKRFGKSDEGFYMIIKRKTGTVGGDSSNYEYQYEVVTGKNKYPIILNNFKFSSEQKTDSKKKKLQEQLCLNKRGDKVFMVYQGSDNIEYAFFTLKQSGQSKSFRQDETNFDSIHENFPTEEGDNYKYKIIPIKNKFILLASKSTNENTIVQIFIDNKYVTKCIANFQDLFFDIQGGELTTVFQILQSHFSVLQTTNTFMYKIWLNKKDSDWIEIQHELFNSQICINFPNMFFIYNHDQLYLKDIREYGNQGLTYLNHFFGIDSSNRPLTVMCFNYYHMMCINVPIIETDYTSTQFNLRVHSIVQTFQFSQPYIFKNTFLAYQVYGFNEKLIHNAFLWSKIITDDNGNLDKDVRFKWESNILAIEKWDQGKLAMKALVTHYYQSKSRTDRDITIPSKNYGNSSSELLVYKEETYRLIVIQTQETIRAYALDAYILNRSFNFQDQNSLQPIFTYKNDDPSNPITEIIIDTLEKYKVSIYLVYQNYIMRKFTAEVPLGYLYGDRIQFEEQQNAFKMNSIYEQEKSTFNTVQKRFTKYNSYIANKILYFNSFSLEITREQPDCRRSYKILNLADEVFEGKYLIGVQMSNPLSSDFQFKGFSMNEAKLIQIKDLQNSNTVREVILMPLLNSRIIPTFMHRQFRHPIVPLIDLKGGFITVFTQNLDQKLYCTFDQYNGECYSQTGTYFPTIKGSKTWRWNTNINLNPGIIIKYFNGIEKRIPIKDRFLRITRWVISRDGYNILVEGSRFGMAKESGLVPIEDGIYLYKINKDKIWEVNLVQKILFSVKIQEKNNKKQLLNEDQKQNKMSQLTVEMKKKLNKPQFLVGSKNRLYLRKSELGSYILGEHTSSGTYKFVGEQTDYYNSDITFEDEENSEQKQDDENKNNTAKKDEKLKPEEEKQKIIKRMEYLNQKEQKVFSKFKQLFHGFDIPRFPFQDNILEYIEDLDDSKIELPKKHPNQKQLHLNKQYFDNKKEIDENESDYDYIKQVHGNIHIQVNEQGHIFLINRMTNTLFFFYNDSHNEFKLFKLQVEDKMPLNQADSNSKYLVVYGFNEFKIFNIEELLNPKPEQSILQLMSAGIQKKKGAFKLLKKIKTDETVSPIMKLTKEHHGRYLYIDLPEADLTEEEKYKKIKESIEHEIKKVEENQIEKYQSYILDIYLLNNKAIIKMEDDQTKYLKIYDFESQSLINYIEYDQLMVSGCKKFIWFVLKDQVFDIENNLSTFFMWPGGNYNHLAYDCQDIFNISSDRSIMASSGLLYLAFDYSAQYFHSIYNPASISELKTFKQLYYKLPANFSVLDYQFKTDPIDQDQKYAEIKKIEENNLIQQQQKMQKLMNFLSEKFNSQKDNPLHITQFLLSFFIDMVVLTPLERKNEDERRKVEELKKEEDKKKAEETKKLQIKVEDQKDENDNEAQKAVSEQEKKAKEEQHQIRPKQTCNIFEIMFQHENPRYDIIEEILSFVVKSIELPIVQLVINKSFLQFLEKADTSRAFQQYLEKGILKTFQMNDTEKYSIKSTEQGNKISSFISPIMDENFHRKFQDTNESKKDVEISYIYLGNLLSDKGNDVMEKLSEDRFLELMSIPYIKHLVQYQFERIRNDIEYKTLYPFYSMLIMFSIYSIFLVNYEDNSLGLEHLTLVWQIFYEILVILILANIFYFLKCELKDCLEDYKEYFSSFWNLSDLLSYSLCLLSVLIDQLQLPHLYLRPIASLSVIILWIKLFYFLRVYDTTSPLIRMIIAIVNDMKNFLIVLLIGIIGFTGGLYIMQQGLDGKLQGDDLQHERFVGANPVKAFIYTYRMTLGDFQLDGFQAFDDYGMHYEFYLIWVIFIIGSLFLVIVLLNLLIAIMGETFGKVSEQRVNLSIMEKVLLVSENEFLFNRKDKFKDSKYLIIIQEKQVEGSQDDNIEAQISTMKTTITDKVTSLEKELKDQINETQKELQRKFIEQERKFFLSYEKLAEDIKHNSSKTNEVLGALDAQEKQSNVIQSTVLEKVQDLADQITSLTTKLQEQQKAAEPKNQNVDNKQKKA